MVIPQSQDVARTAAEDSEISLRAQASTVNSTLPPISEQPQGPAWPHLPGYEILDELGRGGMGVVYRAIQAGTKRLVALKMIRSGSGARPEELKSLRIEAEAVARFQHPHIIQIHEVGDLQGQPFLALEFLAGGSLESYLAGNPQPVAHAASLVEILARAMAYAHDREIVHRDLKPANVLLAESEPPADALPLVKITDFGVAKRLDEVSDTQTGAIKGTPNYMAPEQAQGLVRDIGPAADIYALGVILYEMLTGRPPFLGTTVLDTLHQVCTRDPVSPSQLRAGIPRDLETICLKCLEKDHRKRYVSAEALAEDLRRFGCGELILARPASAWERLAKWTRRRPHVAGFAAACLVAWIALGTALVFYALFQARAADLANEKLQKAAAEERVLSAGSLTLGRVQQMMEAEQWSAADGELAGAVAALAVLPQLRDHPLRQQLLDIQEQVQRKQAEQEQRRQAAQHSRDFETVYEDALFYETLFTGLSPADNRGQALAVIRSALGIYDPDGKGTFAVLKRDRPYLQTADDHRLTVACYELLLIWAQIEATPPPDVPETSDQNRQRAERALTLLAHAASLGRVEGLPERTYRLRLARYKAQSQGQTQAPAQTKAAREDEPRGALDWFLVGLEQYQAGQYESARQSCDEVLRLQDSHFWARYVRALCQLRRGRWFESKEELTRCVNRRPEFDWPLLLRGFAASELGFRSAQQAERAGREQGPDSTLVQMYRSAAGAEFASAQADLDSALARKLDPQARYVALANRGTLWIRQQRWDDASRDLESAIRLDPAAYPAYVNLSQAQQGVGQSQMALETLNQAIQLAPDLPELYVSRGRLHRDDKRPALARADYERALALEPKGSNEDRLLRTLTELGELLHKEGEYQAALARFDRAVLLNPDFVLVQKFRAQTLLALDRGVEAGKALDRYLESPENQRGEAAAEVYSQRGLIHAEAGQYSAAIDRYNASLQQRPRDLGTRCHRGWAYLLANADRLALADFEYCLKAEPANANALVGRGNARIRLRQVDAALADAKQAEKVGSLSPRLLFNLACIYGEVCGLGVGETKGQDLKAVSDRLAGHQEKALQLLQQALESMPAAHRAAFWKDHVQTDAALASLRKTPSYLRLTERYTKESGQRN